MRLTRAGEYGIRCVLFLAKQKPGTVHSRREISEAMDLPEGTVKSRLNRGRLELARFIRGEDRSLEKVAAVSGGWFRKAVRKRAAARAGAPTDV